MYDVGRPPAFLLGRSGLGQLGPGETLAECPEPVSTAERDALLNEIKAWTNPHERAHFVEGHPDIGLVYDDIVNRIRGLEQRPKLLRCSKEARDRARTWLAQLDELGRKVRPTYPGAGATIVRETFDFTVFRGPTYTIRANVSPGAPPAPPSAPPGTVITGGGTLREPPPDGGSQFVTTVGGERFAALPLAAGDFLRGELVPGLPNRYLLYGGLALFAWRLLGR